MKKYTQLKEEERVEIFKLRQSGHKIKEILAKLNRAKSTRSRELTKNKYSNTIGYLPDKAHFMAKKEDMSNFKSRHFYFVMTITFLVLLVV
jgi:IS30 family transposase